MTTSAKLALVGDRSPTVRAHGRIPLLIDALRRRDGLVLDPYWIHSTEADDLTGFDGIWVLPGSPYENVAGVLHAIETARTTGIPFLGTCGGFQHAMLEFARNVCGLSGVQHGESNPAADDLLIVPLACSLVDHEAPIQVTPGTRAAELLGVERTVERYHCSYGLDSGAARSGASIQRALARS